MTDSSLRYIRPQKAEISHEVLNQYIDRTGLLRIDKYIDIVLNPEGQIVGASEGMPGNMLIDDCDYCANIIKSDSRSNCRHIAGKVLYGGYFRTQWGHFLMNSTSRLWPLFTKSNIEDIDYILFFADDNRDTIPGGNYREFLELSGIIEKVLIVNEPVKVDYLIVPEIAFENTRYFSKEALAVFDAVSKTALDSSDGPIAEKVFLTRSSLFTAAIDEINIDKIDDLFARNGYTIVSPEKISLKQLISMLNSAGYIASISGSTAHNFVFANPHSEFIIVERTAVINIFQIGVNLMKGITPIFIDAFRLPKIAPSTGRLFLYGATKQLEDFISENDWLGHDFECCKKARKRELRKFLNRYFRLYGYSTGISDWEIRYSSPISEAYVESYDYYKPWLDRQVPILIRDYFTISCMYRWIRNRVRKILNRI